MKGFTWIRFWFSVKFYSSDPANLREEITRLVRFYVIGGERVHFYTSLHYWMQYYCLKIEINIISMLALLQTKGLCRGAKLDVFYPSIRK